VIVSFDLDGTLVDCGFIDAVWFEGLPQLYAEKEGLTLEEARRRLVGEYNRVGMDRLEWYDIKYWFREYLGGQDWRALFQKLKSRIRLYPEVPKVLKTLEEAGYKLIIISNSAREFLDLEIEETKIASHFHRIFSSTSDFKEVKKTTEFYAKICRELDASPSEIVHVGDNWKFDFQVPRGLGITAYYLDRSRQQNGEYIIYNLEELVERLRRR